MYYPIPKHGIEATNRIDVQFNNGAETKTDSGSGFWVVNEDGSAVFITNRHVVDMAYRDKKYVGQGYRIAGLTILTHSTDPCNREVLVNSDGDIDIRVHTSYCVDIAILIPNQSDRRMLPSSAFQLKFLADQLYFESLPWGAQITFTSFQEFQDKITLKPILRTGVISSDPQDDYSSDFIDRKSALLLEALSFSGSSGSPILANAYGISLNQSHSSWDIGYRKVKVIGIMSGHFREEDKVDQKFRHAGLSYCHKSTLLLEMLSQLDSLERLFSR